MTNLVEKNIDLTFRFHVTVSDIPESLEDTKEAFYRNMNKRLLHAVLGDPEQLRRILTSKCALHLPEESEHRFLDMEEGEVEYDQLFAKSITKLSEKDQALWNKWAEQGHAGTDVEFIVMVKDIYDSIHFECVDCTSHMEVED